MGGESFQNVHNEYTKKKKGHALRAAPGQMQLGTPRGHVMVSGGHRTTGWHVRDHCQLLGDGPRTEGPPFPGRRAQGSSLLTWPRKLIR